MKTMFKKILFILLLFSATVPSSTVQANLLNWAAWKDGIAEAYNKTTNLLPINDAFNFLKRHKIAVGIVIAGASVYKLCSEVIKKLNLASHLINAVAGDNSEKVKLLLTKGAGDVDYRFGTVMFGCYFDDGLFVFLVTPLTVAASHCNSEIVKLLLDDGADANLHPEVGYSPELQANNHTCWTALMIAAKRSQDAENAGDAVKKKEANDIIELLLAAGADPLIRAKDGTTVLEQTDSEIINEYMRKKTSGPLKEAVVALPGSLELPNELADLTLKFIYPECEPAQ